MTNPHANSPTWLAAFTVFVDLPNTFSISDMENAVAFGVVQYLNSVGLTANCSAQLVATQGNASVANPKGDNGNGNGNGNGPPSPSPSPNPTQSGGTAT